MNDQYYCVSHELYDFLYHSNITVQGTPIDEIYKNDILDEPVHRQIEPSIPISVNSSNNQ